MKKKNDFNNLFFEIEDKFVVEDVDFFSKKMAPCMIYSFIYLAVL